MDSYLFTCSKSTWFGVFHVNITWISHIALVFPLLTLSKSMRVIGLCSSHTSTVRQKYFSFESLAIKEQILAFNMKHGMNEHVIIKMF